MTSKNKLKKTLYIGLGGTGVSVLLHVKKCFIDIYGEIPPMIGFLAIDTDTAALSKEVTSNKGKSIKLASNELLVCSVRQALNVYKNNIRTYDWVPAKNVNKLSSIAGTGAGAVRSNGRFIAYYNFKSIKDRVQNAITQINQLLPIDSLYEVDLNKDGVEHAVIINVFASVAGGTGSGMLIDTLCLVKEAVDTLAMKANIYPWILLPEIFRAMNSGPSMNNVLYNTYGALRSLDYLIHLDPGSQPAINFGHTRLEEAPFNYAYVINNFNQAGVSFTQIQDIIEVIAKSAFLPSNKMGDEISSPFDNIVVQQNTPTYVIRNKKAWAASVGSAELVYDNQTVGRAYAHRMISQICNDMINSGSTGANAANKFVDHQNVMIRENNGRDDVIDSLLTAAPDYILEISSKTTINDIELYIQSNTDPTRLDGTIQENFDKKLHNTKTQFDQTIDEMLDSTADGNIGSALKFISALKAIIALCKGEMQQEWNDFHAQNDVPLQWNEKLANCRRSGIGSIFGPKMDEDATLALQQEVSDCVIRLKEGKRREWAIRFYNDFESYIESKQESLHRLEVILQELSEKHRNRLLKEQQNASSASKFQIFLHGEEVNAATTFSIDNHLKVEFKNYFDPMGGLHQWLSLSEEQIESQFWNFMQHTQSIISIVNRSIDDVLRSMPPEKVREYLERLKVLASPLWNYNTQGFQENLAQLDRFVIVGLNNRDTDLLSTDEAYRTFYNEGSNVAQFASTHQNDRIYVMIVEDLLPIYAVNNFSTYQRDAESKESQQINMANYIDEKLYNRMVSENFSVMPRIEKDNMLDMWVYGFVFGLIKFDEEKNTYWIRSRSKGSPLKQYRFDLSKQRDVAFDLFKSEGLVKEMEDTLNRKIAKEGRDAFETVITRIKDDDSYVEEYAQLSNLEKENIEEPRFQSVLKLLEREIALMSN